MPPDTKGTEQTAPCFQDYEILFTQAPDAYIVTDARTRILSANAAAAILFSSSGAALFGTPLVYFIGRGERAAFHRRLKRLMHYHTIEDWEVSFRPPHRPAFIAAMTVKALRGEKGRPFLLLWVIRNITERKMMEVQLSDRFGECRRLNEIIPDIIYASDTCGKLTFISGATGRLIGSCPEDLVGKHILDLGGIRESSPDLLDRFTREIELCIARGEDTAEHTVQVEIRGQQRVFELKETICSDTTGTFCGLAGILRDCTARGARERLYNSIVEQSPHGIAVLQGMPVRSAFVNPVLAKMLGYAREDLQSLSAEEIIHPDDRDLFLRHCQNPEPGEAGAIPAEVRIRKENGSWKWLEMLISRIEYNGKPAVQATFTDRGERRDADPKVRALERISQTVLEDLHVGIFRTTPGPTNRFVFVNRPMAGLLGYSSCEDLLARSVYEVYENPRDRDRILARLQDEGTVRVEGIMMRRGDGSSFKAIISAHAIRGGENGIICIQGVLEKMNGSVQVSPLPLQKGQSDPCMVLSSSLGS